MTPTRSLLVTLVAATSLLTACGSGGSDASDGEDVPTAAPTASAVTAAPTTAAPVTTPTPSPNATTPSAVPTSAAPGGKVIDYETDDSNGVTIRAASDTARLTGASADFKTFIAAELSAAQSDGDEGCTEKPQIYVSRLHTGGWAAGGHFIPQCGGYATLWARRNGAWKEVWGGQQLTDCATLRRYAFPVAVVGSTCLDGDTERPYTGR